MNYLAKGAHCLSAFFIGIPRNMSVYSDVIGASFLPEHTWRENPMKRILLCLFAGLSMIAPLQAQLIRSYGVKAAYTSANQVLDYRGALGKIDWDRRSGFSAAAYVEWFDVPVVSVVTQLEYAQRGHAYEAVQRSDDAPSGYRLVTLQDRFDYLSLPILGKLRLPIGIFSPFIEAGPRVDVLLGYKRGDGIKDPLYESFKDANFGASVGVGGEVHAPMVPVTLSLEARYNLDFTDSFSSTYQSIRNNSFDLWLGVGF